MIAPELYEEAARRGLHLEPRGDKLAVTPGDRVPPDFAETLRQHKAELLDWLNRPACPGWQSVPPLDLSLSPVPPRPTPHDRETVISFILRQGCNKPGSLTAWLVRRENTYYEGHGRKWDCAVIAYAAARDAACWQLNRTEREVLEFLAATRSVPEC
ncbi:MAG: hypothetical protein C5B50_19540 [Verrucomicrobia bacterium]|nr:MAG: hypothetical protein C5B50_19540 [Verrucomicrobiota bacterium]